MRKRDVRMARAVQERQRACDAEGAVSGEAAVAAAPDTVHSSSGTQVNPGMQTYPVYNYAPQREPPPEPRGRSEKPRGSMDVSGVVSTPAVNTPVPCDICKQSVRQWDHTKCELCGYHVCAGCRITPENRPRSFWCLICAEKPLPITASDHPRLFPVSCKVCSSAAVRQVLANECSSCHKYVCSDASCSQVVTRGAYTTSSRTSRVCSDCLGLQWV